MQIAISYLECVSYGDLDLLISLGLPHYSDRHCSDRHYSITTKTVRVGQGKVGTYVRC